MSKNSIWLMILLILIGSAVFFITRNLENYQKMPYESTIPFEDVTNAITDEEGNLYVIHSNKDLIKYNPTGDFVYKIDEEIDKQFISSYIDMTIDANGNLYVLKRDLSPKTNEVTAESIIRFKENGDFDKTLYSLDYSMQKSTTSQQGIKSLYLQRNTLFFVTNYENEIKLNILNTTNNNITSSTIPHLEDTSLIQEITGTNQQNIAISTKQGVIFTLLGDEPQAVFSNESGEMGRGVPELLHIGNSNKLYFYDRHNQEILTISLDNINNEAVFMSKDLFERQGYSIPLHNVTNIYPSSLGNKYIVISFSDKVITVSPQGTIENIIDQGYYTSNAVLFQWLLWLIPFLLLVLLVFTIRFTYKHVMNGRVSLIVKQALLYFTVVLLSIMMFSSLLTNYFSEKLEKENSEFLTMLALSGNKMVDGDLLESISTPYDYMGEQYQNLKTEVDEWNTHHNMTGFYTSIYKFQDGKLYTLIKGSMPIFTPVLSNPANTNVFAEHPVQTTLYDGQDGKWIESISPIYNTSGEIIGLFEVGKSYSGFLVDKTELQTIIQKYVLLITVVITAIFILISIYMFRPIRKLRRSITEIAKGKWETSITVKSKDEIGFLGDQVNLMSEHVRRYINEMTNLNNTYFRFVPKQFLQYLGKSSILEVELGDQAEREMSLLVLKMRSFFSYSKNLTPEENFSFINSFLGRFCPIIQNNNGFINKYMGPGMFSLFPKNASDAVDCAIAIQIECKIYNDFLEMSGQEPIELGIGIHKGPIMLGIIGDKERVEGAVISDHANLTELLEELSKTLGVSILATENIINDLHFTNKYDYRNLGMISVDEHVEPIQLYDVFEGDSLQIRRLKKETKPLFEEAINMYQEGRFYDARTNLIEVIKRNPSDIMAKLYFFACDEYYQKGTNKAWSGSLIVN